MADYNHVTLVGRPVQNPELMKISDDRIRSTFTIAVGRPYLDHSGKKLTDFFTVVSYGKLAEIVKECCKKGEDILVDGRLQGRSYEVDNVTKWITEIVADNISFMGKSYKGGESNGEK